MSRLKGGCLCGQIHHDSAAEAGMTAVSHCPDWRRQSGMLDDTRRLAPQSGLFRDTAQSWWSLEGDWPRAPRNPPPA